MNTPSRRFDSTDYLELWKRTGRYPPIHDGIYHAVATHADGYRILDLCCSTGLLGERIRRGIPGAQVVGVEADRAAINAARDAGIEYPILELKLGPQTLARCREFVAEYHIDVVVARRCIPELCDGRPDFGHELVAALAGAGVEEVFLQGRVPTTRAVNAYPDVDAEIELFRTHYALARRHGAQVAVLRKTLQANK